MKGGAGPGAPGETIQLAEVADFWLGELWVQPSMRRVSAGAREEMVEPRVMQALVALAEADGSVVSRDALIERCWGGRIVGEDAINRCVAKVRRLAETAEPAAFNIETIAKVGYRLRSAPREAVPEAGAIKAGAIKAGAIKAGATVEAPVAGRRLWPGRGAVAAVLLVAAGVFAWAMGGAAAPPADRMTLRIDAFGASGPPPAGDLASAFTQAAVERLSESEILVITTAAPAGDAGLGAPRYVLSGTIQIAGGSAKIMVQVVDRLSGKLLYTTQTQQPAGISQPAVYGTTVRLLAGVERHIREAEFARYDGEPRDVQDMVLQASAASHGWQPGHEAAALALGERALAQEPGNLAAQSVMATLLFEDFMASDATRGDAEGRRALALIENVLRQHPRNLTHRHLHAALLQALGDLRGAQAEAESALADEPDSPGLQAILSLVLLQQGDVAGSVRVLSRQKAELNDITATQEFAEGRYEDALLETQRNGSLSPSDGMSLLLRTAILERLGQVPAARAAMAQGLAALPPELRRVAALRQCLFGLPDVSWGIFKESLIAAGMAV
jgi:DNA-binding winged helix-turn-helix (wHTH) protein/tetratricopeptide (TPR) repeat protein